MVGKTGLQSSSYGTLDQTIAEGKKKRESSEKIAS
jgi:hypothetical protein